MERRWWMRSLTGIALMFLSIVPSVFAADGDAAPAAGVLDDAGRQQILQTIEATRATDPELAAEMEQQLQLLESGQFDPRAIESEHGRPGGAVPGEALAGALPSSLPRGGYVGPPVDGGSGIGPRGNESLPPEVRSQLEQLFREQGTGDPAKDGHVREQAEKILREHGIDPREVGPGHEGWEGRGWQDANGDNLDDRTGSVGDARGRGLDRDLLDRGAGIERSWEQMSPEAREQLERFYGDHEGTAPEAREYEAYRELFEREAGTLPQEHETLERAFEAPTAPVHEYEAPAYEGTPHEPTYEAPQYEAPPQP